MPPNKELKNALSPSFHYFYYPCCIPQKEKVFIYFASFNIFVWGDVQVRVVFST